MIGLLAAASLAGRVGGAPNRPDWRWMTLETEHFAVHYPEPRGDAPVAAAGTAQRAAAIAEALWLPLGRASGFYPRQRIHIVLRDDGDALAGHSIPAWRQVVISVAPGPDLARARGRTDLLELVLAHELAHVFTHPRAARHAMPATVGPELGALGSVDAGPELVLGGSVRLSGNPPSGWSEGTAELAAEAAGVASWTPERDATIRIAALAGDLPTWTELQLAPEGDLWGEGERRYQAAYGWARASGPAWAAITDAARSGRGWRRALREAGGRRSYEAWVASATAIAGARIGALEVVEGTPTEGVPPEGAPATMAWWPRLSPDGRWRADQRGAWLGLTEVASGESRWMRAAPGGGYAFIPGSALAVAALERAPGALPRRYGWSRLFLVRLDDAREPVREIPGTERASAPAVSPDGSRLAWLRFADGTHRVVVADLDGGGARELDSPPGARLSGLSWAPDGSRLVTAAWWRGAQDLWEIPADGSPARRLTATPASEDDPWWAPDGGILFAADVAGIADILRLDPNGAVTRLTRVPGAAATPSLDPDGTLRYSGRDATGWRPYVLPSELWVGESVAWEPDPQARPASGEPSGIAPRPYSPLRATLPVSLVPLLRVDGAGYPGGETALRPRAGAWLSVTDAVEDHEARLLALLGRDLVVAGGYTFRGFGPDLSLDASHSERHPLGIAVDRGALAAAMPVVDGLTVRASADAATWRGLDADPGRGLYAAVGLSVEDRRVDAVVTATRGWTDAAWGRIEGGLQARLHPAGTPDDHRFELGGTAALVDRPMDPANALHAGGDHPWAWYTAALQSSTRFPGFAPYSLRGERLAIATGGWQIPVVHDRAVRLGPVIGTDLLVWVGGDVGDVWTLGSKPILRGDLVGDLRWKAALAGAPWDGMVRAAWAPGEEPRIYLSLGAGW